ncbi:uncharacterized protein LOC118438986 [Folsomia candida]|uniref:uncharacterized protein LOC118438986 n=1 Tax=Folsomia candida TaxID=158441 RepID=UPI0016054778|nr:uncharacterized protein LOC118438986 [Folsomia candida]
MVLSYLLLFSRIMLSYNTDVIILTTLLALYLPISSFYKTLQETALLNPECFSITMSKYSDICKLIGLVNSAFSRLMLTYVLEAFTFYSVYLKELTVFDGECIYMQCKMGFLFFSFCSVFYLCGEISSLMEKSKFILINTNSSGINQLNLVNLRIQLSSHFYGISGNGFFLINYSFITTLCSTLLTYFIISVQFQSRVV